MNIDSTPVDTAALVADIRSWAHDLGFQALGVTDANVGTYGAEFQRWLAAGFHGEMAYMARRAALRLAPAKLLPGTVRVLSARMDYLPPDTEPIRILNEPTIGYISRYALGRDYHKVVRSRLARLAARINAVAPGRYRAFTDSAPVLEKPFAAKAGLGWVGKHTLVLNRDAGSWFFLGEIFTDLPLPLDAVTVTDHCGRCSACMTVCPTRAIVGPRQLDARRCISYLTIEHKGTIPVELRPLLGNRIFGCDDCQLVCPWNRFARPSAEADFLPRHTLDRTPLLELFAWDEATFLTRTAGSALRRIRYPQWLRNLAVALGNAPYDPQIVAVLRARRTHVDAMVAEHIDWAIGAQRLKAPTSD
jgi:epoxyqueuosine reductase